jgi:hypothetical protein
LWHWSLRRPATHGRTSNIATLPHYRITTLLLIVGYPFRKWLFRANNFTKHLFTLASICVLVSTTRSQDLDPRSYTHTPVNVSIFVAGVGLNYGNVLLDPTLPIKDLQVNVQTPSIGFGRTFGFYGKSAQIFAALPFSWAKAEGTVNGQYQNLTRTGFSDARLRFSVLLKGAPALQVPEYMKRAAVMKKRETIIGTSLSVNLPIGQYYNTRLINLGTNRFAFKPELAISQPIAKKWLMDMYAGVWLFTNNNQFFPGEAQRKQEPMCALQFHLSYNLSLKAWVAINATFYSGGNTSVNGIANKDRQNNLRLGGTIVVPTGKFSSLKIAASSGAIVAFGADFTTISVGWQRSFLPKPKAKQGSR